MMTLLAASLDQGTESFQFSVRMRRATSRRNALTSSPASAANDTCVTLNDISTVSTLPRHYEITESANSYFLDICYGRPME